jgi:hypothetical protein
MKSGFRECNKWKRAFICATASKPVQPMASGGAAVARV